MDRKIERKKKNWIGKAIVILLFAAAILAYMWIPSVHDLYNEIARMFTSGDFIVVRTFVESDFTIYCCAASGVSADFCQCKPFWMVAGGDSFMVERDGRRDRLLLYCSDFRPRRGGKDYQQSRVKAD